MNSLIIVAGMVMGADPFPQKSVYVEMYDEFMQKVSHGHNGKLFVGIRPSNGTTDDLWIPTGTAGFYDGVYHCYCQKGKAVYQPLNSPPILSTQMRVGVPSTPFLEIHPTSVQEKDTYAPNVGSRTSQLGSSGVKVRVEPILTCIVNPSGGTNDCAT